jgi:hypothetical protein
MLALGAPLLPLCACKSTGPEGPVSELPAPKESWCPEGFESGPRDTCFLIPENATKDTPILLYLHGLFEKKGSPQEFEAVRIASQRGFAVVMARGKRALCAWRTEVKDQYCWPQDPEDTPTIKSLIGEWDRVLWQVDALLEGGTHRRYVLGSGGGGAFASFIATHGFFPGQAYGVVGAGPLAPPGRAKQVPLVLLGAQDDPAQGPKMRELHETLAKSSWPHAYCPRTGQPAISADDVEAAVRFFKHDADGTLKPQGGSIPCDPKR